MNLRCTLALLGMAAAASGCALFPQHIGPPESVFTDTSLLPPLPKDGQPAAATTLTAGLEADLVKAWQALAVATAANEKALADSFLSKAISVVDARCDQYFSALGRAAQKMSFAQKELGLTTGLVAALQGLTGAASKDIAITASGLGFLGASSNAYGDVFIFSPEVSGVQALVAAAQDAAKLQMAQLPAEERSKANVIGMLQDYEKTCEVHTIRRLVNESLAAANPVAGFGSDDTGRLRRDTQATLAAVLKVPGVDADQLAALYWFSHKTVGSTADRERLAQLLAGFPDIVDSATGKLKSDAELDKLRPTVKALLALLVDAERQRLEADLAVLRQGAGGAGPSAAPAPSEGAARRAARAVPPPLTVRVMPSVQRR
jgi:hypothetical protein